MNRITIKGFLGQDPKNGIGQASGKAWASFSIADSEGRDKPTIWWRCMASGENAEFIADNWRKGSRVEVEGKVSEKEWQGKKSLDVFVFKILGKEPITSADQFGNDVTDDIPF